MILCLLELSIPTLTILSIRVPWGSGSGRQHLVLPLSRFPNLRQLTLQGIPVSAEPVHLSELRSVDITLASAHTPIRYMTEMLRGVLSLCPRLEELSLHLKSEEDHEGADHPVTLPRLRELRLMDVGSYLLASLFASEQRPASLERLDFCRSKHSEYTAPEAVYTSEQIQDLRDLITSLLTRQIPNLTGLERLTVLVGVRRRSTASIRTSPDEGSGLTVQLRDLSPPTVMEVVANLLQGAHAQWPPFFVVRKDDGKRWSVLEKELSLSRR